MKSFFLLLLSFLLVTICCLAQPARHVVLISIDAMRPEFYLDPVWPAPTLQRLKREGVYAERVIPVFPTVTYPNHTSIITGALPVHHGIGANTPFEPEGVTGRWNWEYSLIKCPTLWSAVRSAGLSSAAVVWPVTVGAPIDYNVPDIWSLDRKTDNIQLLKQLATPRGIVDELEANATGQLKAEDINSELLRTDENTGRMAAYLLEKYRPALTALHLVAVDHACHTYGREGQEVRVAVAAVDRVIAEILEALEKAGIRDSTAVLVVGDHGFSDVHSTLFPNVWLKKAGILGEGPQWKAMFQSASGSAFLHLQRADDSATLRAVRALLSGLPAGQQRLFTVFGRDELDKAGADRSVALALSPLPGIAIGGSADGEVLRPAGQKGTHGYYPSFPGIFTGMVGWGTGVRAGFVIPTMGIQDIAPIVARLLGVNFAAPDGVLFPGIVVTK
ncbi:MAG TPA: ectonucleotide pyrophosphatase/phosphodiesterase [Puia sp.]|jgi:hypothetical protein